MAYTSLGDIPDAVVRLGPISFCYFMIFMSFMVKSSLSNSGDRHDQD